ncbi:MAG TPA: hypothetical protein VM940_07920 [Chthoniobacterales bacterium]|jgi:hypothetical protein|nr:hypothetical protein [Chthoniobacterales bacterium]
MIKTKILLFAIIATSLLVPAAVQAQGISIEIGDRPYYRHGPRYWAGDYQMIWVPGHRSRRGWVHGHYVRGHHRSHFKNRRSDRRFENRLEDRHERHQEIREDIRDAFRR